MKDGSGLSECSVKSQEPSKREAEGGRFGYRRGGGREKRQSDRNRGWRDTLSRRKKGPQAKGVQVTTRNKARQGSSVPLEASSRSQPCQHHDSNPARLISDFRAPEP